MKKIAIYISLSFILLSCKKEHFDIQNLDGHIIPLGHGGMGVSSTYPMNSIESVLSCFQFGMYGSELDIQMTKDGVLVLFHNGDLSQGTTHKGLINSMTWDELKGAKFIQNPYLSYDIITLDELFRVLFEKNELYNHYYYFDCKTLYEGSYDIYKETYADALVELIEKYQINDRIFVESTSVNFLETFQSKSPYTKLFTYVANFEQGLRIASQLELYGIVMYNKNISKEQVQKAHQEGFYVGVVNLQSDKENREAIKKNVDIIQTDRVKSLAKLLNL